MTVSHFAGVKYPNDQANHLWNFHFHMRTFSFGLKNGLAFGFKSLLFKTVLVEHDTVLEFDPLFNEWDEDEKGTAFGFKLLFAISQSAFDEFKTNPSFSFCFTSILDV